MVVRLVNRTRVDGSSDDRKDHCHGLKKLLAGVSRTRAARMTLKALTDSTRKGAIPQEREGIGAS